MWVSNFSKLFIACLLVLSEASAAEYSGSNLSFQGKAFSLKGNDLLYTEYHEILLNEQGEYVSGVVSYERPDGERIAFKTLDFTNNPLLPDLNFVDQRTGHVTDVLKKENAVILQHRSSEELEQSEIRLEKGRLHVADAGFDRLVLQHWQALLNGDVVSFDVLALSRKVLVGFEIEKVSPGRDEMSQNETAQDEMMLSVQPKNWFMRLLVEPITLVYDIPRERLKRYEGITNIPKEDDGNILDAHYQARIEYLYSEERYQAVPHR